MNFFNSDCQPGSLPYVYNFLDNGNSKVTKQQFTDNKTSLRDISFNLPMGDPPNIKNYLDTYTACGGDTIKQPSPNTNMNPKNFTVYYTF